jgi:hypothetical protein
MTPKEKAKELVDKMFSLSTANAFPAKQCALIAIDEIMYIYMDDFDNNQIHGYLEYWNTVKEEIEKL